MQTQNKVLDDLARLASSALGVAAEMRSEVEARFREQFERMLSQMDLVTREEFDAVKAMAVRAREEQETLAERVAALEAKLAAKAKPVKSAAKAAPARKTPRAKAPKAETAKTVRAKTVRAKTARAKTGGRKTTDPST